ncbi:TIGR04282 family arsenosugar biosynthesis glycosyltransferase [Micromonospora sp. D93]|uniref:TIGR04282 family arsenosugar biosynthesis glycosyltransferase n=1 Tax=Micromonospora sp. D93 TaxID=2824886 RepID=UPI001B37DC33|nr:TIGR04282 family arsenosugar biosynthesis glycosyltransferase [Micromonospora sp. D93]
MTVLLVMAKAPVPGAVKTRLCPPASHRQAARIAAAALLDSLDTVRATPGVTPVLALHGRLADGEEAAELTAAIAGWQVLPQRGADLGNRLANAHADVADAYPGRPVLQIGMDTPQLTPAHLDEAVHRLTVSDAVLGPAIDGGWWALGLHNPRHAAVLTAVPMSTALTGHHTIEALRVRGLRVDSLPLLRDVDEWPDALAVAASTSRDASAWSIDVIANGRPGRAAAVMPGQSGGEDAAHPARHATCSRFARQVAAVQRSLTPGFPG